MNSDRNARSVTSSSNAAAAPGSILDRHSTGPVLDHISASSASASRPGQDRSHAGSPTSRAGRAFSPGKARKTGIDNDRGQVEVQRDLAGSFDLELSTASGCGLRFLAGGNRA
ncbi:MAG TPA: hypothetical protein VE979_18735 [Streptosporangiaceae bacterium]|nr:hypothetical protein [Streptosporangiaceae bacterium]